MGKNSKIGWTDHTHNIVWGCEKVSPACDNCYAEELDSRYYGEDSHWGKNPRKIMSDKYWRDPLRWNREAEAAGKPQLVFCSSMADVFEKNDIVESQRPRLWALIEQTPFLRWLLLTKRPQNIKRMLPKSLHGHPNIWLGTTIESPTYLWRANNLCEVPAPVHFLSLEPLLQFVDLRNISNLLYRGINWVIAGCESGSKARPTKIDWFRELRDTCEHYEVPYFLKQAPRAGKGITVGPGSSLKFNRKVAHPETGQIIDGLVEAPYLDGKQWTQYPAA